MTKKLSTSKVPAVISHVPAVISHVPAVISHVLHKKLTPREIRSLAALNQDKKKGQAPSKK